MGVIYKSFKQEPFEPTHITAWGKIGGITSWATSVPPDPTNSTNPRSSQREKYFEPLFSMWTNGYDPITNPRNFRSNISVDPACFNNLAVFNEIGFGIGNRISADYYYANASNNYFDLFKPAYWEMTLNRSEIFEEVTRPTIFYQQDNLKYINENIMACGSNHVLAMYTDSRGSTLYAWGKNGSKQCNIPTTLNVSNVKMVTAGHRHSIALENN